ncbi:NAD-P-binding protein [Marasmius fiardii PR-910]|nr:NAD-P-binding protein [Marasmius fiardii PR-910]
MSPKVKILVTGATGYIGGSVLGRFLSRSDVASFHFTAIVRSPGKADKLKEFGITPIIGSHNDESVMVEAASKVDVVIAMADCDDLVAANLTLQGLKIRFEETGKPPIFINTSGTGVLCDYANGMYPSKNIYDDENVAQLESLPPSQPHRNVDLAIIAADKEGYIRSYTILPSTIYSIAQGKLFDAGISHPYSMQIPGLIKLSIYRGQAGMVGEGKNIWPNVNIHDLADLYSDLYDSIVSNPSTGHGRQGFYFGENGEHSLYEVGKGIGEVLVELGKAKTPEPNSFTKEEVAKYFRSGMMGSNARCRGNRSKAIGWKPNKTTADMLTSIKPEAQAIIENDSRFK